MMFMPKTKAFVVGILTLALSAAASSTASADVQLTIKNGRVSLIAKDATLRQILAEWAKVGQTKIVNGDRVPGAPLTLQFTNMPEQQALETLLRGLSGYVAQARDTFDDNLSRFDRILVMPTVASPVTVVGNGSAPPPPVFPQPNNPGFPNVNNPAFQQAILPDDQEDAPPARGPVFNQFPQPQVFQGPVNGVMGPNPGVNPASGPLMLPSPQPGGVAYPAGVSAPGMIAPGPPQPGQPGQPIPPKRPGGNL
jgi:hypothetical protein